MLKAYLLKATLNSPRCADQHTDIVGGHQIVEHRSYHLETVSVFTYLRFRPMTGHL